MSDEAIAAEGDPASPPPLKTPVETILAKTAVVHRFATSNGPDAPRGVGARAARKLSSTDEA